MLKKVPASSADALFPLATRRISVGRHAGFWLEISSRVTGGTHERLPCGLQYSSARMGPQSTTGAISKAWVRTSPTAEIRECDEFLWPATAVRLPGRVI